MMAEEIAAHGIFKGRDKIATSAAMDRRKDKYPYIEFDQQFPETYLFKEHQHKVWNNILTLLDRRGEIILSKDKNKGLIVTDAKKIPIPEEGKDSVLGSKKIFYEQEIIVKSKGTKRTYVTNHVSCYKSDKYGINRSPISLSDPENTIRGIFFGTLARAFYPQMAKQAAEITIGSSSSSGEIVHVIKNGDTLGKIAAQYTGNADNYEAIATYNAIKNPSAIRIGQRIRIPKRLQGKK